jgi:tetratricopeptide (TPR) repeat protein
MKRESEAALLANPGYEDVMLRFESDTGAYSGQLLRADELMDQAISSASRADEKELVAAYNAIAGVRRALVGDMDSAKRRVQIALSISRSKDLQALAATAIAIAGGAGQANRLAEGLARQYPEDTMVQYNFLPLIRAQTALHKRTADDIVSHALEPLASAVPYEAGANSLIRFGTVYVRGEAYLAAGQGPDAVKEFQKIIDHPGIVRNEIIGALSRLQLGRAYALSGDRVRAIAAYQQFLTLWKDADRNLPIFKQASAEYIKLQ